MDPITGLAYGRIAVGTLSLLSPKLAARLFLLDPQTNPQVPYVTRLFGSREIALGAITLASSGAARERLVQVGIAVDGADLVTGRGRGLDGCGAEEGGHHDGAGGRRSRRRAACSASPTDHARRQKGKTNVVTATTPTTTITPRSTLGGSLRPTVAPSWPPTTEPMAISPAAAQSMLSAAPSGRNGRSR